MRNGVMFQSFEWYMEDNGNFYKDLIARAQEMKQLGFDSIWLPPVFKGTGTNDVGYGTYDLYDLGEFDQNGSIRTKYGTKEELLTLIDTLHAEDILAYMDVVLNHKAGADYTERFYATEVDQNNRIQEISESHEIEAWTGFDFPGRNGKYSDFKWNHTHFSGVDYDSLENKSGVFRIDGENKGWSYGVSGEHGNFDYLMNADIDHANPEVREELLRWTDWFVNETNPDGFRLDAVKHIDDQFLNTYSSYIEENYPGLYLFAEYWESNLGNISDFLERTNFQIDVFDVPLHFNLFAAANNEGYDLRKIFDNTVVQHHPMEAVTFVDNHDSQPGQSLESWIGRHFKERAYALILLREAGYPCVFAGDYYGIQNGDYPQEDLAYDINRLLEVRANYAYGEQRDFFQDEQAIGWARMGDPDNGHDGLLAVTVSMHSQADIEMDFGPEHAGCKFVDYLDRNSGYEVILNEDGHGSFPVKAGSVSCWISQISEDSEDQDTELKGLDER